MGSNNYVYHHDNHHLASTPTGGPAFVAHTAGYNNDNHSCHDTPTATATPAYYYDYHDYDDAPAHNDDDYARAHNDDESADDQHDPADYDNHFRAEHDDYYNRWVNYFDNGPAHYHDIAADYLFPPPDDYYKR